MGSIASPTPVPVVEPEPTPTPSFTDAAKAEISTIFDEQSIAISSLDWQSLYRTCNPTYRARRDLERFRGDVEQYLRRLDVVSTSLDVRNPQLTKGRDDRFDLNFDLYINNEYSQTIRVVGAYVYINEQWYDDGVWCR